MKRNAHRRPSRADGPTVALRKIPPRAHDHEPTVAPHEIPRAGRGDGPTVASHEIPRAGRGDGPTVALRKVPPSACGDGPTLALLELPPPARCHEPTLALLELPPPARAARARERTEARAPRERVAWTCAAAIAVLAALAVALFWRGWDYYLLSLEARPDHPDYRVLSPGNGLGRAYGIAAAALIGLSLAHVVRRRRGAASAATPEPQPLGAVIGALVATAVAAAAFVALRLARAPAELDSPLRASGLVPFAAVAGWSLTSVVLVLRRAAARSLRTGPAQRRRPPAASTVFWFHLHVFAGLAGTLLALFHSAFQVRTPLAAVTVASLLAVLATGLVGWFVGALCPGPDDADAGRLVAELDALEAGLGQRVAARLSAHVPAEIGEATLLRWAWTVSTWLCQARQRRLVADAVVVEWAGQRTRVGGRGDPVPPARRCARLLARRPVRRAAASALLRSWRSAHRYAAVAMLLAVAIHVAVAVTFGFAWGCSR